MTPATLYDGHLAHIRHEPAPRMFRHRIHLWLVDLDDLPYLPWWIGPFSSLRAADHLGTPTDTIRFNIDAFLAESGIDLDGGPVMMLTTARVMGHVFNPLTVYWCHHRGGELAAIIAEVHNTYGQRHCYLLPAAECEVDKQFYVSPFFHVSGRYRMRLPMPGERLSMTIALLDGTRTLFTAVLSAQRLPADRRTALRLALTNPLLPHKISTLIRLHGAALWIRGLPVVSRPADAASPADPGPPADRLLSFRRGRGGARSLCSRGSRRSGRRSPRGRFG